MPTPRKPDWAKQKVEQVLCGACRGKAHVEACVGLLKAEHARSVRIVKRALKDIENGVPPADRSGYIMACNDILAALKKGRT